jgi:hypothetical protein
MECDYLIQKHPLWDSLAARQPKCFDWLAHGRRRSFPAVRAASFRKGGRHHLGKVGGFVWIPQLEPVTSKF